MDTKRYVIWALLAVFVGWLVFSPEDETPQQGNESRSDSGSELRLLPKEPEPLPSASRHGIVGAPARPDAPYPDYDDRWQAPGYYGGPQTPDYYGRPQAPTQQYRKGERRPAPTQRFSFRPLTERERQRLRAERPATGFDRRMAVPQTGLPEMYRQTPRASEQYPQRPAWPANRRRPAPSQWSDGGYTFRPLNQSQGTRERWSSPYRDWNRDWQRERDDDAPWSDPSAPQWGSAPPGWMPPAERMYPSLHKHPDGKLTAR